MIIIVTSQNNKSIFLSKSNSFPLTEWVLVHSSRLRPSPFSLRTEVPVVSISDPMRQRGQYVTNVSTPVVCGLGNKTSDHYFVF